MKWALIGASDIASTRMIAAIQAQGDSIISITSKDQKRAAAFAVQHNIPLATTDIAHGIAEADAVYISSTNEAHAAQTITALEAGKHVLCEKPMALTLADANEMVEKAAAVNRVLALNHHLPGSPLHVAVKEAITHHNLGEILSVRVNHAVYLPQRLRTWRLDTPAELGGGVIFDITCHDLSVLIPLLGATPTRVFAAGNTHGTDASDVMTVMDFQPPGQKNKVLAYTHDSFESPHGTTALEVQCQYGYIKATDAMTQDTSGVLHIRTDSYTTESTFSGDQDIYSFVLTDFAQAIRTGADPITTGVAGVEILRTLLALNESLLTSQFVELPRKNHA